MSTIKTTTLSTQGGSTVPVDTVVNGTAKAWVNFNGTGTVAIRRAFNVSSITDNGTADYTINFTTGMPDVSYAAVTGGLASAGSTIGEIINVIEMNTGSVRLRTFYTYSNQAKSYYDPAWVSLAIFS
jgi:hypothetical protein